MILTHSNPNKLQNIEEILTVDEREFIRNRYKCECGSCSDVLENITTITRTVDINPIMSLGRRSANYIKSPEFMSVDIILHCHECQRMIEGTFSSLDVEFNSGRRVHTMLFKGMELYEKC